MSNHDSSLVRLAVEEAALLKRLALSVEDGDSFRRLVLSKTESVSASGGRSLEFELTPAEREIIVDWLSDEFCEKGLRRDDEPNAYGIALDDLIDSIRRE